MMDDDYYYIYINIYIYTNIFDLNKTKAIAYYRYVDDIIIIHDDDECGAVGVMSGRGKWKYSEKSCSITAFSTTNPR
jgi:hypothetical protein